MEEKITEIIDSIMENYDAYIKKMDVYDDDHYLMSINENNKMDIYLFNETAPVNYIYTFYNLILLNTVNVYEWNRKRHAYDPINIRFKNCVFHDNNNECEKYYLHDNCVYLKTNQE